MFHTPHCFRFFLGGWQLSHLPGLATTVLDSRVTNKPALSFSPYPLLTNSRKKKRDSSVIPQIAYLLTKTYTCLSEPYPSTTVVSFRPKYTDVGEWKKRERAIRHHPELSAFPEEHRCPHNEPELKNKSWSTPPPYLLHHPDQHLTNIARELQ